MFLVCLLLGVVWWQALLVWLVTAGLDTGWKHGEATSLGHWPPNAQEWPYWKGALVLVASGLVFTLPVALATWYPWFLLGGAAMWLAYDLGWRLNLKTPEFRGPELGEWLTGAFRTLPTLGAILWG